MKTHSMFKKIILCISVLIIFISYIYFKINMADNLKNNAKSDTKYAQLQDKTRKTNIDNFSELNLLFFDKKDNEKTINFLFSNNRFNGMKIEKVELFQDKILITDKISLTMDKVNGNLLTILLLEYVKNFNTIRIHNSDGFLDLNVGLHILEEIDSTTSIKNDDLFKITSYHTKDMLTSFQGNFTIQSKDGYKIEAYVPKKLKDMNIITDNLNINGDKYIYTASTSKDFLLKNNLKGVNFDVLFYQTDIKNTSIKGVFSQCFICLKI